MDVQATLRINSADSTGQDAPCLTYDDNMELDEDELLALGPPQLLRNPNTTLLRAMAQEEKETAALALSKTETETETEGSMRDKSDKASKSNDGGGGGGGAAAESVVALNEEAGVPGMAYVLLPKSSRGLLTALSDQAASQYVQQELDSLWGDGQSTEGKGEEGKEEAAARRQEILRCLEESNMTRKNVLALQGSSFLFAHPKQEKSMLCDDMDTIANQPPLCLSNKSPATTPAKVQFSENVDSSSAVVHQDCLLLGAPECSLSFLGTGCAIPSKYRNVSGILLQLSAESSMLLDCGEGTWQQLLRMVREHPGMCRSVSGRPTNTTTSPGISSALACQWLARTIKVVWISHPHADHHLGLMTLVAERKRHWQSENIAPNCNSNANSATNTAAMSSGVDSEVADDFVPLLIIAPPSVLTFLDCFTSSDRLMRSSYIGIDNHAFEPEWAKSANKKRNKTYGYASSCKTDEGTGVDERVSTSSTETSSEPRKEPRKEPRSEVLRPVDQQLLFDIGIQSLENVQVHHCFQSFGLRVNSSQGWSLVYSGDTRPCPQLVRLGRGATVLVHEATFDDTRPEEAVKKRHSTISEAIQVAQDMNAHRLILTHFSQRYPGMPPLPPDYLTLPCGLLLAFDFMHVKFADLLWTHTMNPALLLAFPPEPAAAAAAVTEDDEQGLDDDKSHSTSNSTGTSTSKDTKKRTISQHQNQHVPRNKKVKST